MEFDQIAVFVSTVLKVHVEILLYRYCPRHSQFIAINTSKTFAKTVPDMDVIRAKGFTHEPGQFMQLTLFVK